MVKPCSGLVLSSPAGPRQHRLRRAVGAEHEVKQEAPHLRHAQRNQLIREAEASPFSARARWTERKAWAKSARVMKRYHAPHFLTSY